MEIDMEFKAERDIPIPGIAHRDGRKLYDFPELQPGESFFIPGARSNWDSTKPSNPAFWAARTYYRRKGYTMRLRTVDGGVRLWRIG